MGSGRGVAEVEVEGVFAQVTICRWQCFKPICEQEFNSFNEG